MQRPIAKTSRPDRVNLSMPKLPNRSSHQARTGWSRIWRKFLLKYYLNLCTKITNKKPVVKQIGNLLLIGWLLNHSKSTKSLPEPTELYQCQNGSAEPTRPVHLYKFLFDLFFQVNLKTSLINVKLLEQSPGSAKNCQDVTGWRRKFSKALLLLVAYTVVLLLAIRTKQSKC